MVRRSRALWFGALAALFVGAISFSAGIYVEFLWGNTLPLANILGPANRVQYSTPNDLKKDFNVYWESWNLVEHNFYRKAPLNERDMVYSSIEGMFKSLGDEYTFFQRPDDAEKARVWMSGEWEGIGAYIEWKDKQLVIIAPIEDSPAQKAGIQPGDIILKIDGSDLAPQLVDLDASAATEKAGSLIRGPKGTTVKLTVMRPSTKQQLEFAVVRASLPQISVRGKLLDGNVGYIQLTQFSATTTAQLDKALTKLLQQHPKSLILDLRNNPGGLLTSAQEVIGRFVNGGTALYEQYGNGSTEEKSVIRSAGDPKAFDIPMVVLINNGSASAAEIVAGALRDRGRAILLGEKSFGKGSVQTIQQLSDTSSARITIAHWLTPNHDEIHKIGLTPKYVVPAATDTKYEVKLPQQLPFDPASVKDAQLWWAIRALTTEQAPPVALAK